MHSSIFYFLSKGPWNTIIKERIAIFSWLHDYWKLPSKIDYTKKQFQWDCMLGDPKAVKKLIVKCLVLLPWLMMVTSSSARPTTLKLVPLPLPLISTLLHLCVQSESLLTSTALWGRWWKDSWTNNLIHYFNEVSYRHSALATLVLDEWHFHSTVYGSISVLD